MRRKDAAEFKTLHVCPSNGGGSGRYKLVDGDFPAALSGAKTQQSTGGGIGKFSSADGDYSLAALRGVKTQTNPNTLQEIAVFGLECRRYDIRRLRIFSIFC